MDMQNFLDPMGGSGRGTIWDGGMGLFGMAIGPLFQAGSKRYLKKELSLARRQRSIAAAAMYGPQTPRVFEAASKRDWSKFSNKGIAKAARSGVKRYGNTISAIGWAYTASWLFDIGQSALTPGISKSAARSNQELILNESPLDSGRAFTQRQRAMQAIYESQGAVGRSMIGQESSFLHM